MTSVQAAPDLVPSDHCFLVFTPAVFTPTVGSPPLDCELALAIRF